MEEQQLQELVTKAQRGDTDAFATLYDHFVDPVYRYASFRLPADTVEDVCADIFVKVWEKLHTYKARRGIPFGAWLFRIARHHVVDVYRAHRGWEEVSEELPDNDDLNKAETRVKRQHLLQTMRTAMQKLPQRYREVLQLSYVADLPHHEVARVLHTTEGSVRTLKFRALKKLEQVLPPDLRDES
jgi:RNA polymerase sigma-70 factor (ECF subfamily)